MKNETCHPCLCSSVRQLSRVLSQIYDDALRPCGLRATQFLILMTLQGLCEASLKDLEFRLDIEQSTLTRTMSRLETERLVSRVASEDQRERRLCLTAKGTKLLEEAKPLWAEIQGEMQVRLGEKVWERFRKDLVKVRKAVLAKGQSTLSQSCARA